MKIIFISNYFNHHQEPFSNAMFRKLGDDYTFLAVKEVEQERINMGWKSSGFPSYVKHLNTNDSADVNIWKCKIEEADVVIGLAAYYELLAKRLGTEKITFLYSERLYKSNLRFLKAPLHAYRALKLRRCYMLCSSAYTSFDYSLTGNFLGKCYKWGYFPEVRKYESIDELIYSKNNVLKHPDVSILWVSRLIVLKHPELPVQIAKFLKSKGYRFKLTMIGVGPLESSVKKLITNSGISDCVELLGRMSPEDVRKYMETSDIFLFTSDRNEGWGAVLNEAMNSGCAVVANQKIGSVPFLLRDGENGLIYKSLDELYAKVEQLMIHPALRKELGKNAYSTMTTIWNAETACENFFKLLQSIQSGQRDAIKEGPCSKAEIIFGL